jgi:hypothetical protein
MTTTDTIQQKLSNLPESLVMEVLDFTEYLEQKWQKQQANKTPEKFNFNWEGGLSDVECSSVELQHQASEWR